MLKLLQLGNKRSAISARCKVTDLRLKKLSKEQ
jgi:hypothetical protein